MTITAEDCEKITLLIGCRFEWKKERGAYFFASSGSRLVVGPTTVTIEEFNACSLQELYRLIDKKINEINKASKAIDG